MTDIPPPSPQGYQPAPGEGITEFSVRASRSHDYQSAEAQLTYSFPTPRAFSEALPIIDELQATVDELAYDRAKAAAEQKQQANLQPAAARPVTQSVAATSGGLTPQNQPPAAPPPESPDGAGFQQALDQSGATQIAAAPAAGQPDWRVGTKPRGGTFKYLSSNTVGLDAFKAQATEAARQAGVPVDQVVVFDDRIGQRGLEGGNQGYSAGKVKAAQGSQLEQVMGDRTIVGYVDFNDDGTIKLGLSKEGTSALQALQMAARLAS